MTWHLFSLVLASTTSWAVLAIGFLPISVLRQHGREPIKAAGAWALVAATASSAVYHWYLIFALICLVALTKLDRPAGKVVLAIAASLGLSIGIVFPLEAMPEFLAGENPFALASLYLGGAATGLAYAVGVVARAPDSARRTTGYAQALLIAVVAWTLLIEECLRRLPYHPAPLPWPGSHSSRTLMTVSTVTPLVSAIVLIVLAFVIYFAARRNAMKETRWLAAGAAVLALLINLVAQFVYRLSMN